MNSRIISPDNDFSAKAPFSIQEGRCREALARFFLSLPPAGQQSDAQRAAYRAALRLLHRLEIRSMLQNAALPRPLLFGDLYGMLRELLTACRRLLDGAGVTVSLHLPQALPPVAAGIEPRITAMAAVALFRCAVQAGAARASLTATPEQVMLTFSAAHAWEQPEVSALAREAARLHRGCFIQSGNVAALSFHAAAVHTGRWYIPPTADVLLRDPLSPVHIGLCDGELAQGGD